MTEEQIKELKEVVKHQANMESLWGCTVVPAENSRVLSYAMTFQESVLMGALRHIHAVIEGDLEVAEDAKKQYWNLESEL